MSVFADILVLAALIAAAWLGAKRGLLKSLAGLLIVVVALLGASWAADHLSEPVMRWVEPRVTQRVEQKIEESHAADAGQMLQALSFRGDSLQKLLDTVSQRVQETGESLIRAVSLSVARSVASTAVYVVSFLVLLALLWLLMKPLNAIVTRLPLVSTVNGLGGAFQAQALVDHLALFILPGNKDHGHIFLTFGTKSRLHGFPPLSG